MGISIPGPAEINMADMVGWKETIVDRLNKGVQHLLDKAGVETFHGWATFQDAKSVKVMIQLSQQNTLSSPMAVSQSNYHSCHLANMSFHPERP